MFRQLLTIGIKGMKKLYIIMIIAISVVLLRCSPYTAPKETAYPKPFEFTLIDSVRGSKEELYVKAHEWMAKTFNSSKAVIQMQDKEAGKIVGRGIFAVNYSKSTFGAFNDNVNYIISIDVKDGRYRCVLSDFRHESGKSAMASLEYDMGSLENEKVSGNGVDLTNKLRLVKNSAKRQGDGLLSKLQIAMKQNASDF